MTDRVPLAEPAWYAVMTSPRQEGTAATGLRRAGLWPAYPLDRYQVRIRRAHGRTLVRWVDRPHFPRYVFLALRFAGESLAPAYSTKGVVNIVCRPLSGEPLRIPCAVMDAILAERLVALDDDRGAIVMSETHLAGDSDLRVFLSSLGRWRCERTAA
jgi:transcription antitermination factor NusG